MNRNPQSTIRNPQSNDGFTIIELIVTTAILSIIFVIAFGSFYSLGKAHKTQDELSEANHNARVALNTISRAITWAGSGLTNGSITASSIGGDVNGVTDTVTIIDGGSDTVSFVGVFDEEKGRLKNAEGPGGFFSVFIGLENSSQAGNFDTNKKKYISIGGQDAYTILFKFGKTIIISSSPLRNYAAGTPVYLIKDVTYQIEEYDNVPVLTVSEPTLNGKLVEGITDIQLELLENDTVGSITVTAITKTPDRGTVTLHSLVKIRNK